MKGTVLVFCLVFLLTTICGIAPTDVVPGAVFYLDAADNPAHDDAWENLGTAGGELTSLNNPPELEKGTIEIPALGAVMPDSEFYSFKESGHGFGGDGDEVALMLSDFSIEFLLRRNGDKLGPEHHLAGFQNTPAEGQQGIRLNFWEGPDDLTFSVHTGGGKAGTAPLKIVLPEGEWHWIALVLTNGDSLVAYQDGEEVSNQAGFEWDDSIPIDMVMIGANSYGERPRTFNGSIAIVRVYDKPLADDQVRQNIDAWMGGEAVEPDSKLTMTWGAVKTEY